MDYRVLEIEQLSAKDLRDLNTFSTMDVYIVASISSDPGNTEKTPVDKSGGTDPDWKNHKMKFTIDERMAQTNQISLTFQIISDGSLISGDSTIGFAYVPIKDLFRQESIITSANNGDIQDSYYCGNGCYPVATPSGKAQGTLTFTFRLSERFSGASSSSSTQHQPVPQGEVNGSTAALDPYSSSTTATSDPYQTTSSPYALESPKKKKNKDKKKKKKNKAKEKGSLLGLGVVFGLAAGFLESLIMEAVCS